MQFETTGLTVDRSKLNAHLAPSPIAVAQDDRATFPFKFTPRSARAFPVCAMASEFLKSRLNEPTEMLPSISPMPPDKKPIFAMPPPNSACGGTGAPGGGSKDRFDAMISTVVCIIFCLAIAFFNSLFGVIGMSCVKPGTLAAGVRDGVSVSSVSSGKCVSPVTPSSGLPTLNGVIEQESGH